MKFELIAPCHFGLEACTKKEIEALSLELGTVSDGRVSFFGDENAVCRSNIFLRTAERVLLKTGEFTARTWDELFEQTKAIPWENYIPRDGRVWVAKASSIKSKLFSPKDFQTIIQKAIVTRLQSAYGMEGQRLPMSGAEFALRVFVFKDVITIGIDTSGESLHRRGYRKLAAKAPITETLAAALLQLTPWRADRILVDPFCGSGTFCIEAAMMAAQIAPGMNRNFAATAWTDLIPKKYWYKAYDEAYALADAVDAEALSAKLDIQGYDIDGEIIACARENARAAGVDRYIHFQQREVAKLHHAKKYGFIVTNPPYGERLSEKEEMPKLYRELGERFAALPDWSMYLITAYEDAEKYLGRRADKNRKIYNGMMKTYFYSYLGAKPPKRKAAEKNENQADSRELSES